METAEILVPCVRDQCVSGFSDPQTVISVCVEITGSFLHDSLRTEGKAGGWLQTDRVQAIFYELLYYFGLIPEVMTDPFPTVAEL